ncbi:MAG: 50S ribosomal protein L32 [Myxococcales bacterium]|nr:50S ribosomal protein L32 [Myxococcales bacterium]
MAVPKKRKSRSKRDMRRATYKISAAVFNACSKCTAPKQPHRICGACGWYDDRYVLETKEVEG